MHEAYGYVSQAWECITFLYKVEWAPVREADILQLNLILKSEHKVHSYVSQTWNVLHCSLILNITEKNRYYNWIISLKQYVPRMNQPIRTEVNKNQNFRKVKPPNVTPRKNTITNGKIVRSIEILLTQRPLSKMKTARFTTFHPLDR